MIFLVGLTASVPVTHGCHNAPAYAPSDYQGIIEYEERIISFEESGRITEVRAQRGMTIQAGDMLARLDPTLAQSTRDARAAELDAAKADLALLQAGTRREDVGASTADVMGAAANEKLLRTTAERARTLFADAAITQAELDKALANHETARAHLRAQQQHLTALKHGARREEIARALARVQQVTAALAVEDIRLSHHVLHAHDEGTVLDVHVKRGELAKLGTPAVTMADIQHPFADVFVPVGSVEGIVIGKAATVVVDGISEPFAAVVEFISPNTEFTPKFLFSDRERPNLVLRVRLRINDPSHRLHSGVPAFARIPLQ